ncbi:MAG: efflux RND transporter periplasmic adaptor subunit [Patescibacteria group bacterium]|nr:efflux RND transporter periplasmic adaptor subunit [Patescibacteria group bacterium]
MKESLTSLGAFVFARWRYALGAIVILLLAGYMLFGRSANPGATMTVSVGDFSEQIRVSGTVTAAQNVDLGFATSGRIAGTYAKVGTYVEAGTILAETENGDLIAALAQKRAALAEAQANLASLQAGTRPEEIQVAATAVASAQASLVNAIQNAYTVCDDAVRNKADALFTNPRTNPKLSFSVTNAALESTVERERSTVDSALANWALMITKLSSANAADSAKQAQAYLTQVTALLADANLALNQGVPDQITSAATLSSYGTTLATARTNVNTTATALTTAATALDAAASTLALKQAGSTSEDIAAQQAAVAAASADVRSAAAKIVPTRVIAPFSGIVTRMDAKVGEIVSPTTSEISMQSDGIFQIETYIPEVSIANVAPGNTATTTLDAYGPAVEFPSDVVLVDPAETVKDGVPTYKTTLSFLSPDPRIRSGMTANVTITTGTLHDAIVIPTAAVGTDADGPYVSVMQGGATIRRHVVAGGSPALGRTRIVSGLSAGDTILLSPR